MAILGIPIQWMIKAVLTKLGVIRKRILAGVESFLWPTMVY